MTDERFDRDLRQVLAGIAGREAPASLRDRIERMMDEAPVSRRLWFAAPLRLSLAAVTAVAVVALAIFFSTSRLVGPNPSESPSPSGPSVSPTESATPTTTPQPTPMSTPSPTPQPTQPIPVWTGLDWSSGPGIKNDNGFAEVNDALAWGDGYVGVGDFIATDGTVASAFFTSSDGTHWTMVQQGSPSPSETDVQDAGQPYRLSRVVASGNGLLAVGLSPFGGSGPPDLWNSADGRTWTLVDSATWSAAWDAQANGVGHIIAMVAHGDTIVALGGQGSGCCASPDRGPILVTSTDGQVWHRLELPPVFDNAYVRDVAAYRDGFVIVGRTGQPDTNTPQLTSGVGKPAAWTSADGLTWSAAEVEGAEGAGAQLLEVVAGADGLFATGRRAGGSTAGLAGAHGVDGATSGWASTDGRTWRLVGDLGKDLPDVVRIAGNGTRMALLGRDSCKATDVSGWVSTNGSTWTRLSFNGMSAPGNISGPICQADGTEDWMGGGAGISMVVVAPAGILLTTAPDPGPPPVFWFGHGVSP